MKNKQNLLGKRVMVISDNDCYESFRDEILIITHVAINENEHPGYDATMQGEALCDFRTESGKEVHNSLYEYEFEIL